MRPSNGLSPDWEFRANDPAFVGLREAYFGRLPLATARRALALGCGTGVKVRALKRRPEFRGEIVGVDYSLRPIEEARRRTVAERVSDGVDYRVGDARALELNRCGPWRTARSSARRTSTPI